MISKKLSGVLGVALLVVWSAVANSLVVGEPGNTNNTWPFGSAPSGWAPTYQQIYAASAFGGSITINSLSFYQNAALSNDLNPALGTYTIQLSTTSRNVGGLSSDKASNLGADNTTVFTGTLPAAPVAGEQWDINLDTAFNYDPSQGNLLLTVTANNPATQTNDLNLVANGSGIIMSRAYGVSGSSNTGLVTGFNEAVGLPPGPGPNSSATAVPTMPLYGLGLTILGLLLVVGRHLQNSTRRK